MKLDFDNGEILESPFAANLKQALQSVLGNTFFAGLSQQNITKEGYRYYVKEKYSSVGYFILFLENAERLAFPISRELSTEIMKNRMDELGYFAGDINQRYAHETWRLRTLDSFGVTTKDISEFGITTLGAGKHQSMMRSLADSNNTFFVLGALLFLELFVVYEMKALIAAFERDLPDIFPADGYSYDRFPDNIQEYWYGHALHDTWHYRCLEEPLIQYFNGKEVFESFDELVKGINFVAEAKNNLYNEELLMNMRML